ncbi:unnamed protein product [Discosporangium mesarthrocarpum]
MKDNPRLKPQGLAYISIRAGGAGLKVVTDDGFTGTVVDVPYPTRSDVESAHPPAKSRDSKSSDQSVRLEEQVAKEKARKAAKLEAMQKKLDKLKAARGKKAAG